MGFGNGPPLLLFSMAYLGRKKMGGKEEKKSPEEYTPLLGESERSTLYSPPLLEGHFWNKCIFEGRFYMKPNTQVGLQRTSCTTTFEKLKNYTQFH